MTLEQIYQSFGSATLDWSIIALYAIYAIIFLVYEFVDSSDKKEFTLTAIKFIGFLIGGVIYHFIIKDLLKLKENATANAILSATLIYLINFIFVNMIKDAKVWKNIKRDSIKVKVTGEPIYKGDKKQEMKNMSREQKNGLQRPINDIKIDIKQDKTKDMGYIDLDFSKMKKDE